jgi:hypothetical protein
MRASSRTAAETYVSEWLMLPLPSTSIHVVREAAAVSALQAGNLIAMTAGQ